MSVLQEHALGRILAWASHFKDESRSGMRATMKLIYEEAEVALAAREGLTEDEATAESIRRSDSLRRAYDTGARAAREEPQGERIVLWTCSRCERVERLHDGDDRPECCGKDVRLGERAEQEHEPTLMLAVPFIRAREDTEQEDER